VTSTIINDFHKWTQVHSYWWNDDPRHFITSYLERQSLFTEEQLAECAAVWEAADATERELAGAHLNSLLEAIPPRPAGELIYVMSFLGDEDAGSHVTLLGPTLFRDDESLDNFVTAAEEFITDSFALELAVTETVTVISHSGKEREVHLVDRTPELEIIHGGLVGLAELYGGVLLESHFAKAAYMPHLTHLEGCELQDSDVVELKRAAVSIHPGARINVQHAQLLGSFNFGH
jgi:hypothetical protein